MEKDRISKEILMVANLVQMTMIDLVQMMVSLKEMSLVHLSAVSTGI